MSDRNAEEEAAAHDDEGWTKDHHLVGTTLSGTVLSEQKTSLKWNEALQHRYYSVDPEQPMTIAAFHPEEVTKRQPALWRGLLIPSGDGVNKKKLPIAIDRIAKDLQQPTFSLAPVLSSKTEERLQAVLYQHVVEEWLPSMIVTAALEETNQQYIRQLLQTSEAGNSSKSSWSMPEYYKLSPNSYLTPPAPTSSSSFGTFPITFTPNQLVSRIKQGCGLVWKHYCENFVNPSEAAGKNVSTLSWKDSLSERRSSSRIARLAQEQEVRVADASDNVVVGQEPSPYWRVMQGGKVAGYLFEYLVQPELDEMEAGSKGKPKQDETVGATDHLNGGDAEKPAGNAASREKIGEETKQVAEASVPPVSGEKLNLDSTADPKADGSATQQDNAAAGYTDGQSDSKQAAESAQGAIPMDVDDNGQEEEEDSKKCADESANATGETAPAPAPGEAAVPVPATKDEKEKDQSIKVEEEVVDGIDSADEESSPEKEDEEFSPNNESEDEEDNDVDYVKEDIRDLELKSNPRRRRSTEEKANGPEESAVEEADDEEDTEEKEEVEDTEEVETIAVDNPYLEPTNPSILEWLGLKTAKLLTSSDLQTSFPSLVFVAPKKGKKKGGVDASEVGLNASEILTSLDKSIWSKVLGSRSVLERSDARLVFQIVSDQQDDDVSKWETALFGRAQFNVRLLCDQAASTQLTDEAEFAAAQADFKKKKAWDTWRYECVHGGWTIWPSWLDAVDAKLRSIQSVQESRGPAEAESDRALAESLAQQEDSAATSGRRATRRGGDSGGIFYGNQSMTQKQLMDTLLRLVSSKGFQTPAGFLEEVTDESTDPLRRIRTALGRLVWKRNQVARLTVDTEISDGDVRKILCTRSLFKVGESETNVDEVALSLLSEYIRSTHQTELGLRRLVVEHLSEVPVSIIATAADDRPGSMEAMDDNDFVDQSSIEWLPSGHDYIGKLIYRPSVVQGTDDKTPCHWYRIQDFSKSIVSEDDPTAERPSIGSAKEPTSVERRMRFRAAPAYDIDTSFTGHQDLLLLTQAQVNAGLVAAKMDKNRESLSSATENPFAGGATTQVSLFKDKAGDSSSAISGLVVGFDSELNNNGEVSHKILVLPEEKSERSGAFWARLDLNSELGMRCSIIGEESVYYVQQFDYHSSSPAFRECQAIVNYLRRHPKAGVFLEPVDPVALGIPQYFDIVKHPMDISTLAQKLEDGKYSTIPPSQSVGKSPITRMLNGPFRRDLELIFDNAMLFNPPDDWIHIAAATLKKSVLKKIEQTSNTAEEKARGGGRRASQSIYVDYDSDAYVYESDQDDDYDGSRLNRKRKRSGKSVPKEDTAARPMERSHRLQKLISDSGLRGRLGDLPINGDASTFSLPPEWTCRRQSSGFVVHDSLIIENELDEYISLQKQVEENETIGLRRSTRSHGPDDTSDGSKKKGTNNVEYVSLVATNGEDEATPSNRLEVEIARENLHENFYAKLYKESGDLLTRNPDDPEVGGYNGGSFPPYLGRVVPCNDKGEFVWEIRLQYVPAALRWVIRGLVHSGHLSEIEPLTSDTQFSGVILANNVYYLDDREPFEVLDSREMVRRKRAEQEADASSEDEVELSEYEKLRAERVKRNEERLKALGLA